jgi:hypothetical protein
LQSPQGARASTAIIRCAPIYKNVGEHCSTNKQDKLRREKERAGIAHSIERPSPSTEVKNGGAIPPLSHMSSWRGA